MTEELPRSPLLEEKEDLVDNQFLYISLIVYSCILLLCSLGNIIFTHIVISSSCTSLHTVTNYLLVNLSLADLMIAWICIPLQMTILSLQWFPFGSSVCYIITFLQPVAIFTSSFTLVIITLERYLSIIHPLRRRLQNWKLLILMTWTGGCLVSLPDVFLVKYQVPEGEDKPQCYKEADEEKSSMEMWYDLSVLTIQYIGPVLIMVYSYSMIAFTIWRKTESGLVQSSQSAIRKSQMIKSKQKVIKMLIVVVTVYTLCYFPINIGWLLLGTLATLPNQLVGYIHTIFLSLALSHTCCNPLIYLAMDNKIRFRFLKIISSVASVLCLRKYRRRSTRDSGPEVTCTSSRRHTVAGLKSSYKNAEQITAMTVLQTRMSSDIMDDREI